VVEYAKAVMGMRLNLAGQLAWLSECSHAANIPKFFVFRFVWEFVLFFPIWVVFLQETRGLSLTQVTLIDLAFWLTVVLGEIPTGVVADTWGRKPSIILGVILTAMAVGLFALAPTYPLLLLANALWAFGTAFDSGAALALLYDSLRQVGREAEYTRLRGRLAAVTHISVATSGVLGGLLGALDLTLPFLLYAGLLLAALVLVCGLYEAPQESAAGAVSSTAYVATLAHTAQFIRQHAHLRYVLLYSALLPLAISIVGVVFLQPYARAHGVPIAAMGFLVLGLHGVRSLGAAMAHRLAAWWDETTWIRLAPGIVCLAMLGLGLVPTLWGLVFLAVVGLVTSAVMPMVEAMILRQAPAQVRATILSVDSLLSRLLWAMVEPGLGVLGDAYGLAAAFLALGIGSSVSLLVVLTLWARVPRVLSA
jgi:Major Facilitator Superfamily